jgi:beta-lactamase regulating signal transducer with metallopeptidase domain
MLVLPILSLSVPAIPLRLLPAPPLQVVLPVVAEQPASTSAPAAVAVNPGFPDWRVVGAAGWLVVVLVLCGRMILGYFFARRLFRRGVPVELPPAVMDVAGGSRYELREAASISVPLTLGWLHPVVLLPAGWRTWDHAKLRAVMAHELAHVRRSDWLIMLLASLNKCMFWFHPLAWWLERKLGTLAEEACDDDCLLALDNREQYAQALLEMAAAVRNGQGRLGWEAMAMARASQVRKRLERVMDETRKVLPGLSRARWSAAVLCAAPLVCGLAVLQLAPAQTVEMDGSAVQRAATYPLPGVSPTRLEPPRQFGEAVTAGGTTFMSKALVDGEVAQVDDRKYFITGEVRRPGAYPLTVPTKVLDSLAIAGGLDDRADVTQIVVLRGPKRFSFNYRKLVAGGDVSENILLEDRDMIFVPQNQSTQASRIIRAIRFQDFEGITIGEALDRLKKSDLALAVEKPYRPEDVEEARRVLGAMFAERGQPDVRVKVEISDIPPRSIQVVFTAYRP